jgi:hypothetical protein
LARLPGLRLSLALVAHVRLIDQAQEGSSSRFARCLLDRKRRTSFVQPS